ncbi:MAG TPA: hypothetical protein VNK70_02035 [Candidatus Paceibacterota bacterium]|nr:hypothetical protein [Candidatus Paceibacterota bacterium]
MRLFAPVLIFVAIAGFASAEKVSAIGVINPFGGKVVTNSVHGVVCPGAGPITIIPMGISPVGPYAVTAGTKRYPYGTPTPSSWILGLYGPMSPICHIPATAFSPPIPVPAFPIILFGTSKTIPAKKTIIKGGDSIPK